MEVHKHPHHVTHKKRWVEYLLEFLMLFLAVFLGFIAENIREHEAENEKGIQYIGSFCEDLKEDSIELTRIIFDYKQKVENLNLISACNDSVTINLPCSSCLKTLVDNSSSFDNLNNSDRTLLQLKNAGGLRLLSAVDADSITAYDNMIKNYKLDEATVFQTSQDELRNIASELFDYNSLNNSKFSGGVQFIGNDKILMNKYFNTLGRYYKYCKKNLKSLEEIKIRAINVRRYFLKKYKFA